MLYKTRARDARPYGHDGVMRSYFFRNIVGARIARPLLEFVQNFGFAHLLYSLNFCEAVYLRQRKIFTGATKRALPIVYTGETRRKQKKPLGGRAG